MTIWKVYAIGMQISQTFSSQGTINIDLDLAVGSANKDRAPVPRCLEWWSLSPEEAIWRLAQAPPLGHEKRDNEGQSTHHDLNQRPESL